MSTNFIANSLCVRSFIGWSVSDVNANIETKSIVFVKMTNQVIKFAYHDVFVLKK